MKPHRPILSAVLMTTFLVGCNQVQLEQAQRQAEKAKEEAKRSRMVQMQTEKALAKARERIKQLESELAVLKKARKDQNIHILENVKVVQPGDKNILISITREGKFKIAQKEYSEEQLKNWLHQAAVKNPHSMITIRSDARSELKYTINVIHFCNQVGLPYRLTQILGKE